MTIIENVNNEVDNVEVPRDVKVTDSPCSTTIESGDNTVHFSMNPYFGTNIFCFPSDISSSFNQKQETASSSAPDEKSSNPDVTAAKEIDWAAENADGFAFRDYDNKENERFEIVKKAYSDMHENQTHAFVKGMHEKWRKFDKGEFTIMEIIKMYIF